MIGGDYAVIIIDISLPDGNGFALYQDIRRVNQAPVIFLTALDDEDSIVKGFDLGAEDYITKPFSTRELIARVKRLTRRSKSTVTVGEITLDLDKQAVFKGGEKVELTALEYRICSLLMQNHGAVVTREMIFEKIWDIAGNYVNDNTLSVYIRRIRQKLGTGQIKTVKGAGYRMERTYENRKAVCHCICGSRRRLLRVVCGRLRSVAASPAPKPKRGCGAADCQSACA